MSIVIQESDFDGMRQEMVEILRSEYRIKNDKILVAMSKIRRHMFVPEDERIGCNPYGDYPCPIGYGQTMSQPFIVAYMTQLLELKPGSRVLEIGTGSGYQAAILAELGAHLFSIETVPELASHARRMLAKEGCRNVRIKTDDGYKGWPEHAPYEGIIVTCGPEEIPGDLVGQLAEDGRMVLPLGSGVQQIVVLTRKSGKVYRKDDIMVRFVPMVHEKGSE